jgi:ketosteroid isomerase-like protein
MKKVFVAVLLIALASSLATAKSKGKRTKRESEAEQTLMRIERELGNATLNLDPAPYDRYWADDFVMVTPAGQFAADAKAQHRAALTGGKIKFETFEIADMKVRVFGDAAIVIERRTVKYMYEGREISTQNLVTSFFAKRNGRWQKVAEQTTKP